MSSSANAAPPVPWNCLTGSVVVAPAGPLVAAAAGAAAPPPPAGPLWALVTVLTEANTDCAAVMVSPALVRPLTNPRRDTPFDRYWITRSRMGVSSEEL